MCRYFTPGATGDHSYLALSETLQVAIFLLQRTPDCTVGYSYLALSEPNQVYLRASARALKNPGKHLRFPGERGCGLGDHQFIKKPTLARNAARLALENTQP